MSRLLAHSVIDDVDVEMAIVLGSPVTAVCGKRWVPTLHGDEVAALPDCPSCHPPRRGRKSAKGQVKTAIKKQSRPNFVYRCYDADGRLIYVGCTATPNKRLRDHAKNSWWATQIAQVRVVVFPDRQYALAKEREAIETEGPRWNVKGRWAARSNWAPEDYVDYLTAIRSGAVIIGTYSTKHLAEVQAELDAVRGVGA